MVLSHANVSLSLSLSLLLSLKSIDIILKNIF